MIWLNCIFGILILKAISCSSGVTHEQSFRVPRQIVGGIVDKDPNDPKYYSLAQMSLDKYEIDQGTPQHHVVLQVVRATEQLVSGTITRLDFFATPTNCNSGYYIYDNSNCQVLNPYDLLICQSSVYEQPWTNTLKITVKCNSL